jgi:hypothetical protein
MSMSAGRLQLAIAPAGAGKITALRTLTLAWTDCGGQVVRHARSAAPSAQISGFWRVMLFVAPNGRSTRLHPSGPSFSSLEALCSAPKDGARYPDSRMPYCSARERNRSAAEKHSTYATVLRDHAKAATK